MVFVHVTTLSTFFRIVSEELVFRRRRQLDTSASPSTTTTTTITLEFGDLPQVNITQPSTPSVAQDIQVAGEVDDSVDIEVQLTLFLISALTPPISLSLSLSLTL